MPDLHAAPRNVMYIGVDPGMAGGLVTLCQDTCMATAMPQTERDIWNWFDTLPGVQHKLVAVIEKVHSMPQQGVASSFKFGRGYGGLRMALIAARIPFEETHPKTWQKGLRVPPKQRGETNTQWKNRLKALAQQLYPDITVTLKVADALLIATYCQRKHTGTL